MNEPMIGNYRILSKLGSGGMGEVFKAIDTNLEREVAIKSLRRELCDRPDVVERFRTEAIALGRLNSPHIATVYNFLETDGQYFMIMEYVRGEALNQVIHRNGAIAWRDAALFAAKALDGLEHAHRLNVIHRDLKPANIMLTREASVKLLDFGIARILERDRQTRTGFLIGTLKYMSPEQVQGIDVERTTDLYSLGIVLYEMLTGRCPFESRTDYEMIQAHITEAPKSPREFLADIPDALAELVLRALAKRPEARFDCAAEFSARLKDLANAPVIEIIGPEPEPTPEPPAAIPRQPTEEIPPTLLLEPDAQPWTQAWTWFRDKPTRLAIPAIVVSLGLIGLNSGHYPASTSPVDTQPITLPQPLPETQVVKERVAKPLNRHAQTPPTETHPRAAADRPPKAIRKPKNNPQLASKPAEKPTRLAARGSAHGRRKHDRRGQAEFALQQDGNSAETAASSPRTWSEVHNEFRRHIQDLKQQ